MINRLPAKRKLLAHALLLAVAGATFGQPATAHTTAKCNASPASTASAGLPAVGIFVVLVRSGREAEYVTRMNQILARMRREESGLLDVRWGPTERPREYAMIQIFKDAAAQQHHNTSPAVRELAPAITALMEPNPTRFIFPDKAVPQQTVARSARACKR